LLAELRDQACKKNLHRRFGTLLAEIARKVEEGELTPQEGKEESERARRNYSLF
jgi:hypothetical protein